MKLEELIRRNRSYRRFDGGAVMDEGSLRGLLETARLTASAANRQPLKYALSCSEGRNKAIFDTLAWAAYLKDWRGPEAHEAPSAYIIVLLDETIAFDADIDVGIASQTILLAAVEKGLGGCMVANFRRNELEKILRLPRHLSVALVIALGKPVEKVVLEDAPPGGSIRYYRDGDGIHHVPKRTVDELLFTIPEGSA